MVGNLRYARVVICSHFVETWILVVFAAWLEWRREHCSYISCAMAK